MSTLSFALPLLMVTTNEKSYPALEKEYQRLELADVLENKKTNRSS